MTCYNAVLTQLTSYGPSVNASANINGAYCSSGSLSGPRPTIVTRVNSTLDNAVEDAVLSWLAGTSLAGKYWYPSFAMYPGAYAPSTANVPCLASSIPSSNYTSAVNSIINCGCGDQNEANAAALAFVVWLQSKYCSGFLGSGPVPSYAPPAIPAGPVVAGSISSGPGGIQ